MEQRRPVGAVEGRKLQFAQLDFRARNWRGRLKIGGTFGGTRLRLNRSSSWFCIRNLEPTAGFEPATRYLQIRIYGVRLVSSRVNKCRFVFGRRKFRANKYRQMPTSGHESGGILVVRLFASVLASGAAPSSTF